MGVNTSYLTYRALSSQESVRILKEKIQKVMDGEQVKPGKNKDKKK